MEALGINLPGLIAQVISFILLILLLRAVLYKPVIKMLDKRSQAIKDSLEAAERTKQQAAKGEEEVKRQVDAGRQQAQAIVAEALKTGERLRLEAQSEAKKEADALLERARSEIQQERDAAVEELRREFSDLAILAAERVVNRSLDRKAHQDLIEEVLKESAVKGKG